uniref:Uncharacterized protein n=1 Tax=Oryza sativa subsp. japonica TaxID=39947 RepID=Q6YW40_ORYSJ|nr:hypothetical protein [Oryza sativa Japonica Group]
MRWFRSGLSLLGGIVSRPRALSMHQLRCRARTQVHEVLWPLLAPSRCCYGSLWKLKFACMDNSL